MEELFKLYSKKALRGADEAKMFAKFFREDRYHVEQWFDKQVEVLQTKSEGKANDLRCRGNKCYTKKEFNQSLELYTKALCFAPPESECYALILANRSAVFYMMENYETCLKDIKVCLKSNCPDNPRMKVLIRRIKCCSKLQLKDLASAAVSETLEFLETQASVNEDRIKQEVVIASKERPSVDQCKRRSIGVPKLKDGANTNFSFASSAIKLSYDKSRGRHVVAKQRLKAGDVLFTEKPFIFAPVFINQHMELPLNKCYHCLKTTFSCIPCKYCIRCLFCDEKCRDASWNEFHKWECVGMQANLWYQVGIAFPALRALIKGVRLGLYTMDNDYEADTVAYGNECDNYGCFNKLISNIAKMENVLPLIISATVVVLYLQKKTNFFDWLREQSNFSESTCEELMELVGGRVCKHIAQLQCNSSVINHSDVNYDDQEGNLSDDASVACAIYPSISMMNHSCNPNITMYYIQDMAIAEATETIEVNEEIFNCYGIDYRHADWETRQEHCKSLYYFKCQCRACKIDCPSLSITTFFG